MADHMTVPRPSADSLSSQINGITRSDCPPHHESLQEWVTSWFDLKVSPLPHSCVQCGRECSLTRSFLRPRRTALLYIVPLVMHLPPRCCDIWQRLPLHCTSQALWWYYNGMVNGGRPTPVSITSSQDLLTCGDKYIMNALVYCLAS